MEIIGIVAHGINQEIGLNGHLPAWKLSEDMKFFKETTEGWVVIMGRKTFESLFRPLPNRHNIIITRDKNYIPNPNKENVSVVHNIDEALELAEKISKKAFVIGGAEIYENLLRRKVFDEFLVTKVRGRFKADTFILSISKFFKKSAIMREVKADEKNSHNFLIVKYYN